MDDTLVASGVLIDTAGVGFEGVWDSDTAGNWSALVDLLHHGLFSGDSTKLIYLVGIVFIWYEAVLEWFTVFADIDRCALDTIIVSSSLIDGAGLIGNFVVVHELEGRKSIPTVAPIVIR